MNFIFKAITILSTLFSVDAILWGRVDVVHTRKLQLVGSPNNEHGCVSDGGYQWCESTQSCLRPWITPCNINNYCSNSPLQLCRMKCPRINCPTGKCAMRNGRCCDYSCINDLSHSISHPPSLPTTNTQLNQRCAIGFCENLQDCPRCPSGLTCHNSQSSICAGTCYGTCQHPIRH
tara:strand:- start:620 stop:1147 length:528 start_codon:yes stop_codon:yes gene_type:complete